MPLLKPGLWERQPCTSLATLRGSQMPHLLLGFFLRASLGCRAVLFLSPAPQIPKRTELGPLEALLPGPSWAPSL